MIYFTLLLIEQAKEANRWKYLHISNVLRPAYILASVPL